MRSRFTAYATGRIDHIIATTDPAGPQWETDRSGWVDRIRDFCESTRFVGLAIVDAPVPDDGSDGSVTFTATLEQRGRDTSFTERSRFTRDDTWGWRYHSGERLLDVDA